MFAKNQKNKETSSLKEELVSLLDKYGTENVKKELVKLGVLEDAQTQFVKKMRCLDFSVLDGDI